MELGEIKRATRFTKNKLTRIRRLLASKMKGDKFAIIAGGSYARGEASRESDLDFFVICDSAQVEKEIRAELEKLQNLLCTVVKKPPSLGGAFAQVETIGEMEKNIGGQSDTNDKITRRILFLLEGEWLYNQKSFEIYRKRILGKYIKESISEHQLSRFLLNDLIRYYRTICVDFEYKTVEDGKTWGVRNLKLLFSRKLLYFSGILVVAESAQLTYKDKLERSLWLLSMTPIQRVRAICGARADNALAVYCEFLENLADGKIRELCARVTVDRTTHTDQFRALKNRGHHFTWALAKLLDDTYHSSHSIHTAVLM